MNQKENTHSKKSLTIVKEQNNSLSTSNEELVKRTEIPNSPFQVITLKGKRNFGVMGQYRLTEEFETMEEAIKAIEEINWNNIVKVLAIVHEILKDVKK